MKADHILTECNRQASGWAEHQTDNRWLSKSLKPLFESVVDWLFGRSYVDVNHIWGWNVELTQPDSDGRIVIASIAAILRMAEAECAYLAKDKEPEEIDKLLAMLRGSVQKIEKIRKTIKPQEEHINSTCYSGPSASQARQS